MGYYDGDSREDEDELRSETLSRSSEGGGADKPKEAVGTKRERLRKVLLPAIQSRVAALGGWEDVLFHDGSASDEDEDEDGEGSAGGMRTVRMYKLGDECLGCLKDLKRFWRMDDNDDDRNIARMFFETGVLKNDLVPILDAYMQQEASSRMEKAALASADLLAAMTWPINALEELREAELSGDKAAVEALSKVDFSSLIAAQRAYKAAIVKSNAIGALFKMLEPRIRRGLRDRTERDENVISLILHIFRNLAAIQDKPARGNTSTEAIEQAHLQSDLICKMASDNVLDILILIASLAKRTEYNRYNTVCLEIFYLLFRGVQRPEMLVKRNAQVTKTLREEKLGQLLEAETTRKRLEGRRGVTRHSRFGTTVMIQNGKDRIVMHKQASVAAATTNPGKILDQSKRLKAVKNAPQTNELSRPVDLRPEALEVLQAVAMSFLESSFNPFLASLLTDIKMQRAKIKELDNTRFLFLSRFFLEYFLALYAYERTQELDPGHEDSHDFDLIAEMTEPASVVYVCLRMKMALDEKQPLWTELHAGVDCFVQLLSVMDGLFHSGNADYKEVAEVVQNKLYYDGETLDLVLKIAGSYKSQPIRYLDTVINLVYVLLKALEKFSKNKEYMYVRKKARRRANKSKDGDNDDIDIDDDEFEEDRMTFAEHSFQFKSFEAKFAAPAVTSTLLTYLSFYKEFTEEDQMKRAVNLLHRTAIKSQAPQLFYKATTLDLFKRIWDDKPCLPKTGAYKDLNKLLGYIIKEFFKAAKEYPLLLMEIFFTSSKKEVGRLIAGDDSQSEDDGPKKLRMPVEIVVKKKHGFSWSQEVGIAVALLTDMNRDDLIAWVKDTVSAVAKRRESVISEVDKDREEEMDGLEQQEDEDGEAFERRKMMERTSGPSDAAKEALDDHEVGYDDDEDIRDAATRHIQLKLLLRLLKWESREDEEGRQLIWTIPKTQLPDDLRGFIKIIDEFLMNPLDPENGLAIADLVAKKTKAKTSTTRKKRVLNSSDEDKSSGEESVVFSDPEVAAAVRGERKQKRTSGKSSKAKRLRRSAEAGEDDAEGDEALASQRRRAKRRKEAVEYRTAEFIEDSDDDEDANRAFFEREKALRYDMQKRAGEGNGIVAREVKKKPKKQKRGKKGQDDAQSDGETERLDATQATASQVQSGIDSDSDEDEPVRKAPPAPRHGKQRKKKATSNSASGSSSSSSDSEDAAPVVKAKSTSKTRPKARPLVGARQKDEAGSSERENREPRDEDGGIVATRNSSSLASSPAAGAQGNTSSNSLKRSRNIMASDDEDDVVTANAALASKASALQQTAANSRKARRVVASDDEED